MKLDDLQQALVAFKPYCGAYPFDASHDTLYVHAEKILSAEANETVRACGFWREEDVLDEDADERIPTPEEEGGSTWYCYV